MYLGYKYPGSQELLFIYLSEDVESYFAPTIIFCRSNHKSFLLDPTSSVHPNDSFFSRLLATFSALILSHPCQRRFLLSSCLSNSFTKLPPLFSHPFSASLCVYTLLPLPLFPLYTSENFLNCNFKQSPFLCLCTTHTLFHLCSLFLSFSLSHNSIYLNLCLFAPYTSFYLSLTVKDFLPPSLSPSPHYSSTIKSNQTATWMGANMSFTSFNASELTDVKGLFNSKH